MSKEMLEKLAILTERRMAPAAAVPDALDLLEQAFPGAIGSMLIWASESGDVAGGFSNLLGIETGLAAYARTFANSATEATITGTTFQGTLRNRIRSRRLEDALQMPLEEFYATDMCREMLDPWGIRDMARCIVTGNGKPLGGLCIFRGWDAPPFCDEELRTLDKGADLMGQLLRARADRAVPQVEDADPGMASLDSRGWLQRATRTFRYHLAMQNQSSPGRRPASFDFKIPTEVSRAAARLTNSPATVRLNGVWGQFRVTMERFTDSSDIALTSKRCLPAGLMMFRRTLTHPLSYRQRQVACALAEGDSFHDMAERWQISRNSIITHANFLYDKLGVASKAELLNHYVWANA